MGGTRNLPACFLLLIDQCNAARTDISSDDCTDFHGGDFNITDMGLQHMGNGFYPVRCTGGNHND